MTDMDAQLPPSPTTARIAMLARSVGAAARRTFPRRKPSLQIDAVRAAEADEAQALELERALLAARQLRRNFDWNDLAPAAESARPSFSYKPRRRDTAPPEAFSTLHMARSRPQGAQAAGRCHLTALPTELLCAIAMRAGFFASLQLMHTCRSMRSLFSERAAWTLYMNPKACTEVVTNTCRITTKTTQFDHLVFGTWNRASLPGDMPKAGDSDARLEDVFFEHRTLSEQFDFLGGISVRVGKSALAKMAFFEHRHTLPCWLADADARSKAGRSPPPSHNPTLEWTPDSTSSLPSSTTRERPHTCPECAYFDTQRVLKSVCLLDKAYLEDEEIEWDHTFADGRRKVEVRVKRYQGLLGYRSVKDLPLVHANEISIDGRKVEGWAYDHFKSVVSRDA
ncbi:hypothetical protein HKX48_004821 [Thoreauomyces humboldtii]|nr:hypothetical protein HKX48_004821 [Thoreauomyces humboldtii]